MRGRWILCLLLVSMVRVAASADRSGVQDAIDLCYAFRETELFTECDVSGARTQIDVRIATSPTEARKMCPGIADAVKAKAPSLGKERWRLRIFSPYSGDHPIATCQFR